MKFLLIQFRCEVGDVALVVVALKKWSGSFYVNTLVWHDKDSSHSVRSFHSRVIIFHCRKSYTMPVEKKALKASG